MLIAVNMSLLFGKKIKKKKEKRKNTALIITKFIFNTVTFSLKY